MAFANKDDLRKYHNARRLRHRAEFFRNKKCEDCDSVKNLVIRHKDDSIVIRHDIWRWADSRRIHFLKDCRCICKSCSMKYRRISVRREFGFHYDENKDEL